MDAINRFAEHHFGKAELGDQRRTRRLVKIAAAFAQGGGGDNGGTITSVIRDWHQAKAAYRLLDRPEVTHAHVIQGHCGQVLTATSTPGDYLLVEDSTGAAFDDPSGSRGLGPIGQEKTRGLWIHSTLVVKVDWENEQQELLGLLGQKVWARPKGNGHGQEKDHVRQLRPDRESQRWMSTLEAAGGPLGGTTWTYVADRESDIYELFQSAQVNSWHYVIRAAQARALAGTWAGEDLFAAAARGQLRGQMFVEVGGKQPRTAHLEVRSCTLELRGPTRPGGRLENQWINVVWVRERDVPEGVDPLYWILLTDLPVETMEQCQRVIKIYCSRWLIEDWHKALKTGLKVERSQLSDVRRLAALIGILSITAAFLVRQKHLARMDPEGSLDPQETDASMLAVLEKKYPPQGKPTRRWFWISIARLGGFMARKSDGDPGWLTLWRGWQTLMILVQGYELHNTS